MPFDRIPPYQGVIHPWHKNSIAEQITSLGGVVINSLTSNAWPSGSFAILTPFYLQSRMYVDTMYWINGATVAGQVDMAVYTEDGTKIFGTGPVLQSGTTSLQFNSLSPEWELGPGVYYLALVASSGSATFRSAFNSLSTGAMAQVLGMACAPAQYPLPLTITGTLRTMSSDYIPAYGISSEGTTFI
jgi:hypothetical protein